MSLDPFVTRVKTNMNGVLQLTQMVNGIMMTGDSRANRIIVELYDSNGKITLAQDTKIIGYFIRGDGYTVEVDGSITENGEATIIIPKAAYYVTGALSIAIRMLDDQQIIIDPETGDEHIEWGTKIVIAALSCFVQNTETDSIIDPDHHIPDVQELLAYIDVLDTQYHDISDAEDARVLAEQGRVTAESTRITQFEALCNEIDDMTVSATEVPYTGTPTATISDVDGHKHITFGLKTGDRGEKGEPGSGGTNFAYDSSNSMLTIGFY